MAVLSSPETILKFSSTKSRRTAIVIWVPLCFMVVAIPLIVWLEAPKVGALIVPLFFLLISGFNAWMWFTTRYEISDQFLRYHSGIRQGKIEIAAIREIEKKTEFFTGINPALGSNGLVIHYAKFNDIFLTPENQEAFLEALLDRNKTIVVRN